MLSKIYKVRNFTSLIKKKNVQKRIHVLHKYSRQERGNHIKLETSDPTGYYIIISRLKFIKPMPCYFLHARKKKKSHPSIISLTAISRKLSQDYEFKGEKNREAAAIYNVVLQGTSMIYLQITLVRYSYRNTHLFISFIPKILHLYSYIALPAFTYWCIHASNA